MTEKLIPLSEVRNTLAQLLKKVEQLENSFDWLHKEHAERYPEINVNSCCRCCRRGPQA